MWYVPGILALCLLIIVIKRRLTAKEFEQEVTELFALPDGLTNQAFSYTQLVDLPGPVQAYFRHVLKDGEPYINYVRLKHNGQFKTGLNKKWVDIKGEQYFTVKKPGFIWKGTTTLFTARDMYISDKGRLVVSLFSLYNIVNAKGKKFNQGELLRWLAESVWFPTNLLPSEHLRWQPVDTQTAKLLFTYKGLSLSYIVSFRNGEIIQFETTRYMGDEKLETWIGKLGAYQKINGIIVPTKIEAIWRLAKGDFSYAKFNVLRIDYNLPKKF
ncbi:hypothetical protein IDJ76_07900 [Mucilaginibacter sp. ZB1P21]|uniref:Uncharacterized protein n=2 Tax=Mucilaginibacter glaciei TaxID=2772109 RepID=A0A926NNJ4_9SPHI|nr:hypothetical protein [Mucilaginibacter glaciei]